MERDPQLTEAEAARELRVSSATVRKERQEGRLRCIRIRRRVFYLLSQINEYRRSQERTECLTTDLPSVPALPSGTSSGPTVGAAAAFQQARRMTAKLNSSSRRSS